MVLKLRQNHLIRWYLQDELYDFTASFLKVSYLNSTMDILNFTYIYATTVVSYINIHRMQSRVVSNIFNFYLIKII